MYKIAENEMTICPYNRSHIVSKLRIQKHLVNCEKRYPEIKLATCFYNYSHKVKPENILDHYQSCPNKARVEGARYYDGPPEFAKSKNQPFWSEDNINNFKDSTNLKSDILKNISLKNYLKYNGNRNSARKYLYYDSSSSDEELEPLPMPKTTSKAFFGFDKKPSSDSSDSLEEKKFEEDGKCFESANCSNFSQIVNRIESKFDDSEDNSSSSDESFKNCVSSTKLDSEQSEDNVDHSDSETRFVRNRSRNASLIKKQKKLEESHAVAFSPPKKISK